MTTNTNPCSEISLPPYIAIKTFITPKSAIWVHGCTAIPKRMGLGSYYDYFYCYADSFIGFHIGTCTGTSVRAEETKEVLLDEFIEQVGQGFLEWSLRQ